MIETAERFRCVAAGLTDTFDPDEIARQLDAIDAIPALVDAGSTTKVLAFYCRTCNG